VAQGNVWKRPLIIWSPGPAVGYDGEEDVQRIEAGRTCLVGPASIGKAREGTVLSSGWAVASDPLGTAGDSPPPSATTAGLAHSIGPGAADTSGANRQ